jgi:hypothetical protein
MRNHNPTALILTATAFVAWSPVWLAGCSESPESSDVVRPDHATVEAKIEQMHRETAEGITSVSFEVDGSSDVAAAAAQLPDDPQIPVVVHFTTGKPGEFIIGEDSAHVQIDLMDSSDISVRTAFAEVQDVEGNRVTATGVLNPPPMSGTYYIVLRSWGVIRAKTEPFELRSVATSN